MTKPRRKFTDLPPAQQAGMRCGDTQFREWVGRVRLGLGWDVTASAAAQYVRDFTRVDSRAELNRNPAAAARWAVLLTEFDAWRGAIAAPAPP